MKLRKICAVILVTALLFTNLCVFSSAEEPIEIAISSIKAEDKNITVKGTLSETAVRDVSIYVLPKDTEDYTIDSAESFLEANADGSLFSEMIFASQTVSTAEGFKFAFRVDSIGTYAVLISCEDSVIPAFGEFHIYSFAEYLNGMADDYSGFVALLEEDFSRTGATLTDKLLLLTDEYKEKVYEGMFALIEFSDMDSLASGADAQIVATIDGILNTFKANSENADAMIKAMRDMPELFKVDSINIFDNNLKSSGQNAVKAKLSSKISLCTTPEQLGDYFDSEVARQVSLLESEVVGGINSIEGADAFIVAIYENKDILGINDSEIVLLNRMSGEMKNRLFDDIVASGDTNEDGRADFQNYGEITDTLRQTINAIGENTLALDAINNRKNKDDLIDILRQYSAVLPGLDITGYEALGDSDDAEYRRYVRNKFSVDTQDESLGAAKERFNTIVAEAANLKAMLDRVNQCNYTNMIALLVPANLNLMDISAETKSNYQYVYNNSAPEHTNLINALIKYIPYATLDSFIKTFDETAKASYDKLISNKGNTGNMSGSTGGISGGTFGSSAGRDYVVTGPANTDAAINQTVIFTDIDSVQWAKSQILALAEKGIINGVEKDKFAPMSNVTREQFVKLLVEAFELYSENAVCDFYDVPSDSWFYDYVASACDKGLVNGMDSGMFGTGQSITREDMVLLTYRAYAMSNRENISNEKNTLFDDDNYISDYARDAVYALREKGLITGSGNNLFNPKNTCTRAEAAVVIYNVLNL